MPTTDNLTAADLFTAPELDQLQPSDLAGVTVQPWPDGQWLVSWSGLPLGPYPNHDLAIHYARRGGGPAPGGVSVREFPLGDVLSITTGYLMSPDGMIGVSRLLEYMTGESLFTHQLPRAWEVCNGPLLAQHPQLADADCSGVTGENHVERLSALVAQYGEMLPVAPLSSGEYQPRNPIAELAEMTDAEIVVIVAEREARHADH